MVIMDTDHLSILRGDPSKRRTRLVTHLSAAADEEIGTTIVTVEEQFRGWLALIAQQRPARRQVLPYDELALLIDFFADYSIARFSPEAADLFESFGRIRIGTADRKIAAIAIVSDALLLTANRRDFEKVPGLRFDNWMD